MKKRKKTLTIISLCALFLIIAAAGYFVEKYEKDAFVTETVAKEQAVSYVEETSGADENGLIDINTADAETLTELHGIGDALSERIIDYRTNHGGFQSAEEIMNVPGISESKYDDIKDYIYAGTEH